MPITKKYKGRVIKEQLLFKVDGTFQSLYSAQRWCDENDYIYGSSCKDRKTGGNCPIAIKKGEYLLPQKWIHFDKEDKALVDGVIVSNDFREGEVIIFIFN